MLAIITATLLKFRQHPYDNLTKMSKTLLPMLLSNRRELRHGAIECFTVICSYFNSYKPITSVVTETNPSIKLVFSIIESSSYDALNALRFRLQRNSLPLLTDEGNITPGLVCDSTTTNDPDAKFILLANNPVATPQTPSSASTRITSTSNTKLLQLAMPLVESKPKTSNSDTVSLNFNLLSS